MFVQQYGNSYYGKRLPVQGIKEVLAAVESNAGIFYRIGNLVFMHISTAAKTTAKMGKNINLTPKTVVMGDVVRSVPWDLNGNVYGLIYDMPYGAQVQYQAMEGIKKRIILIPKTATAEGIAWIIKHWVREFEFIGEFDPNDTVTINSKTMEVFLNDDNALHLIGKDDFPSLLPGEHDLIYSDEEGERTVKVKVRWKDRWM